MFKLITVLFALCSYSFNALANDNSLGIQKKEILPVETIDLGFVVDTQAIEQGQPKFDADTGRDDGIKGQLQPVRDAVLSSQMVGQIVKIHVKENQYFKKNE